MNLHHIQLISYYFIIIKTNCPEKQTSHCLFIKGSASMQRGFTNPWQLPGKEKKEIHDFPISKYNWVANYDPHYCTLNNNNNKKLHVQSCFAFSSGTHQRNNVWLVIYKNIWGRHLGLFGCHLRVNILRRRFKSKQETDLTEIWQDLTLVVTNQGNAITCYLHCLILFENSSNSHG